MYKSLNPHHPSNASHWYPDERPHDFDEVMKIRDLEERAHQARVRDYRDIWLSIATWGDGPNAELNRRILDNELTP